MARGWESKSVESQKEDADSRSDRDGASTREERELERRKGSLELSRRRVLQEIAATPSTSRRKALEEALLFLEGEIGRFA
jgi:hypothetical protein